MLIIVVELFDFFMVYYKDEKWGFDGVLLYDFCIIVWFFKLEIFIMIECWVGVEMEGKYIQGMMVVDYYYLIGNWFNIILMLDVDCEVFVDLFV